MEKISVKNLEMIGKGKCGNVYSLSDDKVIKTFHSFIPAEAVEKEQRNSRHMYDMGVPTPNVFDIVSTEEGLGLIYEKISAPSLEKLMRAEPDKLKEYSVRLGKLGRHVHSIQAPEGTFIPAKKEFLNRLDMSRADIIAAAGEDACRQIEELIRAVPDTTGIVHGDFHPDNVLVKDGKLILIDMADVMEGHPIFDLLSLYFLRVNKVKMQNLIKSEAEQITDASLKEKIRKTMAMLQSNTFSEEMAAVFWRGYMEGYLDTEDGRQIEGITRIIDDYSNLYEVFSERSKGFLGQKIVDIMTADGVKRLLKVKDEMKGCLDKDGFVLSDVR